METVISKMETVAPYPMRVVLLLLKDFSAMHTITSIGKELGMTRSGIWKVLKRLEKEKYIIIKSTGKETSLVIPKLSYQKFLQPSGTEEIAISGEQAQGTMQGLCSMGMYNFQIRFN